MPCSVVLIVLACQALLVFGNQCQGCNNTTVNCTTELLSLDDLDFIRLPNDTVLYNNQQFAILQNSTICPALGILVDVIDLACSSNLTVVNRSEVSFFHPTLPLLVHNGTVLVRIAYDVNANPVVCSPVAGDLPVEFVVLQATGSSLSVIGSILLLVTYCLFKSLRTLPSLILMNLAAATLAIDLMTLFRLTGVPGYYQGLCIAVGIFYYFFVMSQFMWTSIMSFQLAKTFRAATQLQPATSKNTKANWFALYLIIGWGTALLLTTVVVIVNFTTEFLQFGILNFCWINNPYGNYVALYGPLSITLVFNVTCSAIATVFICQSIKASKKVNKLQNLVYFRLNIAAYSFTGLSWVFALIDAVFGHQEWASYLFTIFFSIQGLVIFLIFICTRRILKLYWDLFTCKRRRKESISKNTSKLKSRKESTQLELSV